MSIEPEQDVKSWLHLSSMALKNNRPTLSEQILKNLCHISDLNEIVFLFKLIPNF
jgi:hypothetical protein